ncbi:MAG: hypothetical protein PHW56_04895, partial [Methanosarcinaceae archaeon]|nr:hypothetical protein [Methanosarcinaceae archaeon]
MVSTGKKIELTPENLFKLDKLATILSISEDLTIVFVRCNEPVLCDALCAETTERLEHELFVYPVNMSEDSPDLLNLLNEAVASDLYASKIRENKKLAFFVFGLDDAIRKKGRSGRSEALAILNMMRERFLDFKHTIVIWVNTASFQAVLSEAQDFFSWRTTVIEFEMENEIRAVTSVDFGDSELASLSKKELEDRWDYYFRLLKGHQEKDSTAPHKLAYWNS